VYCARSQASNCILHCCTTGNIAGSSALVHIPYGSTTKRLLIYGNLAVAADYKKNGIAVKAHDLLVPSAFYFKVPCILEENN
jgi:predicted N-acetyltransferase YhbS